MMSQTEIDQRNTNALIATAVMYQKQRNALLAALTEVLARLEQADPLPDGGTSDLRDYARAAIAAAKGVNSQVKCTSGYCDGNLFTPREFSPGEFTDCCPECEELNRAFDAFNERREQRHEEGLARFLERGI